MIWPPRSKRMKRVLVVPWSRAPTYAVESRLMGLLRAVGLLRASLFPGFEQLVIADRLALGLLVRESGPGRCVCSQPSLWIPLRIELRRAVLHARALEPR